MGPTSNRTVEYGLDLVAEAKKEFRAIGYRKLSNEDNNEQALQVNHPSNDTENPFEDNLGNSIGLLGSTGDQISRVISLYRDEFSRENGLKKDRLATDTKIPQPDSMH